MSDLRERIIIELREWIEPEDEGIFCQIAERILALLPGPVMPEVPGEYVHAAVNSLLEREHDTAFDEIDFAELWATIRDALIAEQKEHR